MQHNWHLCIDLWKYCINNDLLWFWFVQIMFCALWHFDIICEILVCRSRYCIFRLLLVQSCWWKLFCVTGQFFQLVGKNKSLFHYICMSIKTKIGMLILKLLSVFILARQDFSSHFTRLAVLRLANLLWSYILLYNYRSNCL